MSSVQPEMPSRIGRRIASRGQGPRGSIRPSSVS
jgi:hypothetical protein